MINNRQNGRNNRRGRSGPRPMGGGGQGPRQDAGNRVDSRQRGNASQLHEKYKNLARDAQTQGDRVTAEYYLQFADHYFRVLNEHRARQEEYRDRQEEHRERQRQNDPRYADRDGDDDGDNDMRDDDPTAPIAISGLPPAIGNVSASSESAYDDNGSSGEAFQDDRPARGNGRGRQPYREDRERGPRQDRDRPAREMRMPDQDRSEAAPPPQVQPDMAVDAGRPVRRRAVRKPVVEAAQLDLPAPAQTAGEEEAPQPRRRTRRPRQEAGDAVEKTEA